ncbi:hypothetical protein CL689_03665 [Candidatus Saccharibacteria bacterium]|nr:hypothetical protein [Candidatus Saccharibacteria bacterium]|tara:strand:- start:954 stop:1430 length:477 start_codon:yes stop_codon:yes gene_type:complete
MKIEKLKLAVWMSMFAMMDRKGRSSAEHVRYFMIAYILGMILITYLRVVFDLVHKEPIYDQSGNFVMNFGYWPKFDLISWGAFIAEGLFLHIPFYTLCIRRLNDIGYGSFKAFMIFVASITPIIGVPVFVYFFLVKKGSPQENKWGPEPRSFDSILAN